jgi:hypothetical protein
MERFELENRGKLFRAADFMADDVGGDLGGQR